MGRAAKESFMDTNNNSSSSVPKIIGGIVAVLVCCACALILGAAGILYYEAQAIPSTSMTPSFQPPIFGDTETPPPPIELTRPPIESISPDTLQTLLTTNVPENDPYELACRLEQKCNPTKIVPAKSYKVGDRETFWISNSDNGEHHQSNFTLLYITPHSYFWAENGIDANKADAKALMDEFENKIYPTDREFFGSEFIPGIDNDPHIFVLYASDLGTNVGGYFNSYDSFSPDIKDYSNAHETYVLSDTTDLADEYAYGTLAHEFVHMIQFPTDRNDASWMTEGFAEVGAFINGYSVGGSDWLYLQSPDLQLNSWVDNSSPDFGNHYGQSFLYLAYFLDRFGEEATKAVTSNPEDDLKSIDDTLSQLNIQDPQTDVVISADDVFMDWAAALYLKDGNVGDGRYTYHNYPEAPQYTPTDFISSCPQNVSGSVNQYGIDYITINCAGDYNLHFSGSTVAGLLPVKAHSGGFAFWSNQGNESDMSLTREFDFTNTSGPITLSYQTWFDIEENWDYLYLEASTDGESWKILKTPSGTDYDPSSQSYGWAYTGQTGDWIQEEVDLSEFAGQKVQIRFEYITDALVNGGGLLLDDVRVDAINYQSDFEADEGGWVAVGFTRVQNTLPQTYRLSLILKGDTTTVTPIELNADNTADIPLSLKNGDEAVLIVTGTTRFTNIPAAYQIEIK
jgi:immune inhibitor A